MNIITVIEKNTKQSYNIMLGTGLIFDYQNKKMFHCTDDAEEAEWTDQIFTFEIEGKEVIFYLIEALSYDVIKDMAEVIRIQEMESDLAYMKEHGEHGSSCVGCAYEQYDVNELPCSACSNYIFYLPKKESIPTDPETLDNTIESQFPNDFEEKQTDFMNDVCGSLKETFSNIKTVHPFPSWIDPKTWEIMQKMHNSQFVSTEPHIKVIIDYLWSDELRHFCEGFGVEIQSQDDLDNWIKVCENDNNPEKEAMTDHVFYHLMKLKKLYNL
jgi:hypothetical protein